MVKIIQTAGRDALGEFALEFAHFNDELVYSSSESFAAIHICKFPSRYNLAYSSGSSMASAFTTPAFFFFAE